MMSGVDIVKPTWLFDRDIEWDALARFAHMTGGARMALVYGRRRQGKTLLLDAFSQAVGGLVWQARQQSSAQNLKELARAWSAHPATQPAAVGADGAAPPGFGSWDDAFETILSAPPGRPGFVVLDEFGYLLDAVPGLASVLQAHLTPARAREGATRLVLCGSAYAQMRALLDARAPLRGRASLDLVVRPFDPWQAAAFWGLDDNPRAAFSLHALVGGTPAYRDLVGEVPARGDVARWAQRHLLNPASPLAREGRMLVAEDPSLGDRALYLGVLGAIAEGARRRGEIARTLGRPESSMSFPIEVLVASGWIEPVGDPLHDRRAQLQLAEPMARTQRLLVEPNELRLGRPGQTAADVWNDERATIARLIDAPHMEMLAARWIAERAAPSTVGGTVDRVGPSLFAANDGRSQLDLVATERGVTSDRVLCVGEVKAGARLTGIAELERLDVIVGRLAATPPRRRVAVGEVKRILVARAGFTAELVRASRARTDVELVDLDRIYGGE